jgi:hypothetical protein
MVLFLYSVMFSMSHWKEKEKEATRAITSNDVPSCGVEYDGQ